MAVSGGGGKVIVAAAALIERDGKILACRRALGSKQAGFWEFPGGKVELGEEPRNALRRELKEELGIDAEIGASYEVIYHTYDFAAVLLILFRATIIFGEPKPLHHAELRWAKISELAELDFLPADRKLIAELAYKGTLNRP